MFAVEHVVDTPVVLVIASNRSTRRMVRATLESAGYAVLEAPSGRIALQRLAKHAPDLVLYDLHLPDTDAVDLIGRLRALPGGASVPVLAFSGSPAALARTLSQLTSSDRRFRELVQGLDAIVWEADAASWQVSFVSQRAEAILGYPVERWLAEPDFWGQLIHPEDRARVAAIYRRATAQRSDQRCEYRAVAADGRVVWLRDIVRVVRDSRGRARQLRGVMVDITDQKRAEEALGKSEEQLRQSQKMEALGRLAGGVAHDFNNLLTAILGFADLLRISLDPSNPLHEYADEITKAGERAAALTQQLLAVSRRQVLAPRVLDLNSVVAETDKLLRRVIGEDIDLVTVLDPALGRVLADRGQLEQVLLNLAVNARDAMPHGGKLTIETANVVVEAPTPQTYGTVPAGDYAMLAVSDTGCGMDAETRSHIFEPFFTTKEPGKGTGLGLATVYGIVTQSGGHIWLYSELGRGTTFKIYFPRVADTAQAPEPRSVLVGHSRGSETILLVEDDELVRSLTRGVLGPSGYTVLEASDGDEALRLGERYEGPIDLLVTDVVLPGISGRELAQRLLAVRPQLKVLYMSGYADHAMVHHGVLEAGVALLQKPFMPEALARKVREVLDVPPG